MVAVAGSFHLSHELGIHKKYVCNKQYRNVIGSHNLRLLGTNLSSLALRRDSWSFHLSGRVYSPVCSVPYRYSPFKCNSFLNLGQGFEISCMKNAAITLTRSYNTLQGSPLVLKLIPALAIVVFAVWGLGPLMRQSRNIFFHKSDSSWKKSRTYYVMTSYLQPLLLWTGATLICRLLDPVVLPSEPSQIVKQRLLNFVRSLSTVLALAYCLSSAIQQAQKFFTETSESTDTRNMGFQFAGKAVYTAVWVAACSLFMELLGFSTQKWLTAGGLGTVLLTLAGREIFTNFLSSAMIHATRPFVVNEWIQTKIEGYEVSGTVEHVGWWSPTIVRGEDREAVHIPNHKFTVNVVRNLTQKTHWRIKTHLAISHLDVSKINNIVADMRKVLAKNPQVEQQRLHRRVFLENINSENQALLILVSCFVKTSHFEEYLCVKEAILLDLLRVISHHRARLATPIRTVQKIYSDADLENIPFADSIFDRGAASKRPFLLIEPSYKINGEDRKSRSARTSGEQDSKAIARPTPESKADGKNGAMPTSDSKAKETPQSDLKTSEMSKSHLKADAKAVEVPIADTKENHVATMSISDPMLSDQVTTQSASKSTSNTDPTSSDSKSLGPISDNSSKEISNKKSPKRSDVEHALQNGSIESPSGASPESGGGEKQGDFPSTLQSKQEGERLLHTQPQISRPVLEENIVLGVALEGSKRTLPIEEGMASPAIQSDIKELATCRNGTGAPAEKDKKESQLPNIPSSTSGDQRHQKGE
ncbi:mechanosensitive ion channel protein 2, chloroplastic [Cornus florida]|uniref:mechanosensitive ion channel protein 2, chloroplastic n=1 Tax=Cornus florida TaxID=4283 RepID=UPI00289CDAB6|nr:mechanosensitive ion channel protein 2, chloroplastic [Cornus florida]